MGSLKDKRALVTGGGQGLGRAIAEELLRQGCKVALSYHTSEKAAASLVAAAVAAGQRAVAIQADLTRESDSARLIQEAVLFLGGLDVLVNNAGDLIERRGLSEIDEGFWRRTFDINLLSLMAVTRAALPHLSQSGCGSIVNLSSLAGRKGGHAGALAYSAAKGAVLTWTRALAAELGGQGIRVNAVAPGLILGTSFHATHTTAESAKATVAGIPLGRAGCPEDVARAVAFLASEYDGFISGATLDINGGAYCA